MLRAFVIATAITAGLHAGMSLPAAAPAPASDEAIVHVLNRIGYGPRPGDVEKVRAAGLQRYIDEQLHPERIADRSMAERLAGLTTIGMSAGEIAERIELPAIEARRERKQQAGGTEPQATNTPVRDPLQQQANALVVELAQQKLLRAVYSERQLQEVLTDFWFNHFNVYARKGRERFLLTEYERDAIRPHVLGRFRDLLGATAQEPGDALLSRQLDEHRSERAGAVQAPWPRTTGRAGLNENYARELMELHTLGVDGGYTQKDVTEVARAFTGWTIDEPAAGRRLQVRAAHARRRREGRARPQRSRRAAASRTASRCSTSSPRIRRRRASSRPSWRAASSATTPPPALVDRAAARFRDTDGDLREVMRTILTSPEFLRAGRVPRQGQDAVRVRRQRAARDRRRRAATHGRSCATLQRARHAALQCQPPTGYDDTADAWVNTGALVSRMNFALTARADRTSRRWR